MEKNLWKHLRNQKSSLAFDSFCCTTIVSLFFLIVKQRKLEKCHIVADSENCNNHQNRWSLDSRSGLISPIRASSTSTGGEREHDVDALARNWVVSSFEWGKREKNAVEFDSLYRPFLQLQFKMIIYFESFFDLFCFAPPPSSPPPPCSASIQCRRRVAHDFRLLNMNRNFAFIICPDIVSLPLTTRL